MAALPYTYKGREKTAQLIYMSSLFILQQRYSGSPTTPSVWSGYSYSNSASSEGSTCCQATQNAHKYIPMIAAREKVRISHCTRHIESHKSGQR